MEKRSSRAGIRSRCSATLPALVVAAGLGGVTFALGGSLGGCRIAAPTAADDVRRENAALKDRVAQLEARTSELEAKLAANASTSDAAEIAAATPAVAGIEIDKLSGLVRFDAIEPKPSEPRQIEPKQRVAVYVRPFDGRRRFTQAVGTLMAEVRSVNGAVIASRSLSVTELREAYRSQFSGTYYLAEIDVLPEQAAAIDSVRVVLVDMLTGARHESTKQLARPQSLK